MHIELFPRLSDQPGSVDAMVTMFAVQGAASPTLRFSLDGQQVTPAVRQALQPVRDAAHIGRDKNTHTGLYAFEQLQPGRSYRLTVSVPGTTLAAQTTLKVLPSEVPAEPNGGLHVLLASCFYAQQVNPATLIGTLRAACAAVPRRPARSGPDLGLLMGDQVYLDMPLITNIGSAPADVYRDFEQK